MSEKVNHPAHYGGADDPYEHQLVVRAWGLNYHLGNATKYICRAGLKPGADDIEDLQKAAWYLQAEIDYRLKERNDNPIPQAESELDRTRRALVDTVAALERTEMERDELRDTLREAITPDWGANPPRATKSKKRR